MSPSRESYNSRAYSYLIIALLYLHGVIIAVTCNSDTTARTCTTVTPKNITYPTTPTIYSRARTAPLLLGRKSSSQRPAYWVEGFKHSLASGLAAALSKTLLAPFDTIKTIQQQKTTTLLTKNIHFFEAAREIIQRPNGILEFYSGLGVSVIGSMPSVGLYFGVYSMTKQTLGPWLRNRLLLTSSSSTVDPDPAAWLVQTWTVALSAAIGNTVASFSRVPYEVVKQKLQAGHYANTWLAITGMIRESPSNQIRAFFPKGGIGAQMIRDVPYAVFTLVSYETLRQVYSKSIKEKSVGGKSTNPWTDMMIGAIAGGIGSFLTNPMDVVKTRLQMDTNGSLYQGNIWLCVSQTYLKEGSPAFLRGSIPRLLHKVPANGAFFLFYEWFRRWLCVEEYSK